MTNHQDKELSGDLRKLFVELTNTPEVAEDGAVVGHIIYNDQLDRLEALATSPQLPVAQTVIADLQRIKSSIGSFEVQDRVQKVIDALTSTRVAPVAQMSGDVFAYRAKDAHWIVCSRDEFLSQMWFMGIGGYYECAARRDDGTGIIFREREPSDLITVEQADAIFGAASHPSNAATVPQVVQAPTTLLNAEELAALNRCIDCFNDGEGYDVDKKMMSRLAEIGVLRHVGRGVYETTEFGMHIRMLGINTAPQPVAASPSIVPSDEQVFEAADVTCSAWFAATEEYMFKRDSLKRFAELLTTASNAGEAAQGADK